PSLTNPVDLDAWNANMQETETRRWLTGELESQAVLGSEVIVDEIVGDWAHIVVTAQPTPRDPRGYPGWVPTVQLVVDEDFAALAASAPTATVTALTSTLTGTPSGDHPGIPVSLTRSCPCSGGRRRPWRSPSRAGAPPICRRRTSWCAGTASARPCPRSRTSSPSVSGSWGCGTCGLG